MLSGLAVITKSPTLQFEKCFMGLLRKTGGVEDRMRAVSGEHCNMSDKEAPVLYFYFLALFGREHYEVGRVEQLPFHNKPDELALQS